ncbi:hypothetical protein [Kitasatospora sp. NPDC088346]|uniref:hypothetical protein n=1 Tax=Kitasatospora sp. NPDC088346 TaxID=3364073 RepID=UPI003824EF78
MESHSPSLLSQLTAERRRVAARARTELAAALDAVGLLLPSLSVDWRSAAQSGAVVVELGGVGPGVAWRLAKVIRRSGPPGVPAVGELVLDETAYRVGEFMGAEDGRWWLRPPGGGCEWDVRPGEAV